MSKQKKISQSYSLKKSTVHLVAAAAKARGVTPSQLAEEALRFYALSQGPVAFEAHEDEAIADERELVAAEDMGEHAA